MLLYYKIILINFVDDVSKFSDDVSKNSIDDVSKIS